LPFLALSCLDLSSFKFNNFNDKIIVLHDTTRKETTRQETTRQEDTTRHDSERWWKIRIYNTPTPRHPNTQHPQRPQHPNHPNTVPLSSRTRPPALPTLPHLFYLLLLIEGLPQLLIEGDAVLLEKSSFFT
jgi:hypothetical protein